MMDNGRASIKIRPEQYLASEALPAHARLLPRTYGMSRYVCGIAQWRPPKDLYPLTFNWKNFAVLAPPPNYTLIFNALKIGKHGNYK